MSADASANGPDSLMRDRGFLALLAIAAIVGVVASGAAWGFLKLIHDVQGWVYDDLPDAFGYERAPQWWALPTLAISGLIVALAISRLPGRGGHAPTSGIHPDPTEPVELPGILLAAVATIGLGAVLGPEAPLIALGAGLGILAVRLARRDAPPELAHLVGVSGTFAAVSFLFGSPVIAAVLLVEASGLGGPRLRLILIPGLLAAGIGSLVSIGLGSWTGVDTNTIALEPLSLPDFARPDVVDFLWTVPLAIVAAATIVLIFSLARRVERIATPRIMLAGPAIGVVVAGLAIAFSEATGKGVDQVLFSGESALPSLVSSAEDWSISALALLIAFKGLAYSLSLAAFRGGPVFPALFLGAAGGLIAAELPGLELTPALAVCIGAAVVAVLRLPLSAVVLAILLTSEAGIGTGPLIILGVVAAYLTTSLLSPAKPDQTGTPAHAQPAVRA